MCRDASTGKTAGSSPSPPYSGQGHRAAPEGNGTLKVDYDRISSHYDKHRRGGGPYLDGLVALAARDRAQRVMELGAGTGNNTGVFLAQYPCCLLALEPSPGMLAKGRAKHPGAEWVRASARGLPLRSNSVDFVFGVYVLHHLQDLDEVFRECARVLRGGHVAFVSASHAFIERHPMNEYFPSFAAVDKARFQAEADLTLALERTGFRSIEVTAFQDAPRPIDAAYVDRVADKFISTYELLPPGEYEEGLRRLKRDVAAQGKLKNDLVWESLLIAGQAPGGEA